MDLQLRLRSYRTQLGSEEGKVGLSMGKGLRISSANSDLLHNFLQMKLENCILKRCRN
jgi:hypothetical protein